MVIQVTSGASRKWPPWTGSITTLLRAVRTNTAQSQVNSWSDRTFVAEPPSVMSDVEDDPDDPGLRPGNYHTLTDADDEVNITPPPEPPESQSLLLRSPKSSKITRYFNPCSLETRVPHSRRRLDADSSDDDNYGAPHLTSTPASSQPSLSEPGSSQPSLSQPGPSQPSWSQPGPSKPVSSQSRGTNMGKLQQKGNKLKWRGKWLTIVPITEEEHRTDSRFYLRKMFKLYHIDPEDPTRRYYRCLLCRPNFSLHWTDRTTSQHLEKHAKLHGRDAEELFKKLSENRPNYKRKRAASPSSCSKSSSQKTLMKMSVSRRVKNAYAGAIPHILYTQRDYELDVISEIVGNMHSFNVSTYLKF